MYSLEDVTVETAQTDDVCIVNSVIWFDGEFYEATSTSRRDPSDPVDRATGKKLALGRSLRKLGRQILKEGQDSVRQVAHAQAKQLAAAERARTVKDAERARLELQSEFEVYSDGHTNDGDNCPACNTGVFKR